MDRYLVTITVGCCDGSTSEGSWEGPAPSPEDATMRAFIDLQIEGNLLDCRCKKIQPGVDMD